MKIKKRNFIFVFLSAVFIILSFIIYFLKAKILLDPDFGWAIRLGEFILKNGIPKTDPFSYTMPSYPYVDYEWLTHVGIFKIYSLFGYNGLALIFTLIAISSILICIRGTNIKFIPLQILFASAVLFSYFGIRSQVITWLFFAVVCRIALDPNLWKKYKYFFPILFLLWANLHGGFIVGLLVLVIINLIKRDKKNLIIVAITVLATLLNPYGWRLWREVWISMSDLPIRLYIIEWRPIFFSVTAVGLVFLAYVLAFILQFGKKYKIYEIVLFTLLLMAAFSSARNIPLFLIFALILLKKSIENFLLEVGNNRQKLFRFYLLYVFFLIAISVLVVIQMRGDYLAAKTKAENEYYPGQAVKYLSENLPKGQIFSSYEWGGYLDWKLLQKKVFIDGRMASWRQESSPLESGYIFGEDNSLLLLKISLPRVFKKYRIDTVLLPRAWLIENKKNSNREIISKFVKELKKNNFKEVYRDKVAIIYAQKNTFHH